MVRSTMFLVASACVMLVACGSRVETSGTGTDTDGDTDGSSGPGTNPDSMSSQSESADTTGGDDQNGIALSTNRDVDILFVIDNSGSMGRGQGLLAGALPALVGILEDPQRPANYRMGVTTTDNGNPWCGSTSPEGGALQLSSCRTRTGQFVFDGNPPSDATAIACTDFCALDDLQVLPTTTEYDPEPRPRPWLERTAGQTNLDGDVTITEAAQCAIPQGIAGCGFESHLESMYKALLRTESEDDPSYGFVRSNAVLGIVFLTDEVDCSYNNDFQSIFLPEDQGGNPAVFWSDPDASAPTSAVCWNAGVVCEGGPGVYDDCRAANKSVAGGVDVSDEDAVLLPVTRYIEALQEREVSKQQITPGQEIVVAYIGGVPQGYDSGSSEIAYADALDPVEQNDFGIGAGCLAPTDPPVGARPPVRERELAEAFQVGEQRNLYSICDDDFTGAMDAFGGALRDQLRPACMLACVADSDPVVQSVQPECTLLQTSVDPSSGELVEIAVPLCVDGLGVPDDADVCYAMLVGDEMSPECSDDGWNLELQIVRRAGVAAPPGTEISATCVLSQNKQIDCPNLP